MRNNARQVLPVEVTGRREFYFTMQLFKYTVYLYKKLEYQVSHEMNMGQIQYGFTSNILLFIL